MVFESRQINFTEGLFLFPAAGGGGRREAGGEEKRFGKSPVPGGEVSTAHVRGAPCSGRGTGSHGSWDGWGEGL